MEISKKVWLVFLAIIVFVSCTSQQALKPASPLRDEKDLFFAQRLVQKAFGEQTGGLFINAPFNETLFPPEIAAPVFEWMDETAGVQCWLLVVEMKDRIPFYFFVVGR